MKTMMKLYEKAIPNCVAAIKKMPRSAILSDDGIFKVSVRKEMTAVVPRLVVTRPCREGFYPFPSGREGGGEIFRPGLVSAVFL
jgi:hypothetical protein